MKKMPLHIADRITARSVSYQLFGMSKDEADARATKEVREETRDWPPLTQQCPPPSAAELKRDADFMRMKLLNEEPIEIDDIGDFTDEQLAAIVDQWGFK
jgi:hypothetical protein